ncbi:MAG: ATPase inhibitor subunit zeta [Hyphomonas sp.]
MERFQTWVHSTTERAAEEITCSEEQNFKVTARRNKRWACGLLASYGHGRGGCHAYAKTVVLSDLQEVGDEDVPARFAPISMPPA